MKPTFRMLVLVTLRRLLRHDMKLIRDEYASNKKEDIELERQLDEAIEQEQQEQKEDRG